LPPDGQHPGPPDDAPALERPEPRGASERVYDVVAQRRLQWDNLVWQVPVVGLTAQAFLFTIALSAGNSQFARATASFLALVAALLSMQLMARQRQSELTDAHWLNAYEQETFGFSVHGEPWREKRDEISVAGPFSKVGAFHVWMVGFSLYAIAALVILAVTFLVPRAL
jgi:hypothetical protein